MGSQPALCCYVTPNAPAELSPPAPVRPSGKPSLQTHVADFLYPALPTQSAHSQLNHHSSSQTPVCMPGCSSELPPSFNTAGAQRLKCCLWGPDMTYDGLRSSNGMSEAEPPLPSPHVQRDTSDGPGTPPLFFHFVPEKSHSTIYQVLR